MSSPSPTSSISSSISTVSVPQQSDYLKSHRNITFSYVEGSNTFQQGQLGDSDTFLVGTLHLNYQKACPVKSVHLHFKGTEKTSWYRSQARSKYVYSGEHTLVDQTNKIWEAYDDAEELTTIDIPFKIQLPYNLPDAVSTDIGSVQYILRATVNTKSLIGTTQQIVKMNCPLKRTIILDTQNVPPYKLCGETPSGIEYTFILPPNKSFNLGTYVSIPMKLRFLRPNVGIEKLEVNLRTSMDFQSTTQGESKHVDQQIMGVVISRSELLYSQPLNNQQHHGECTYTINLFIPKKVQPSYQGRFIGIAHFLSVKFCLWGFQVDFHVEESVRIANIVEKHSKQIVAAPRTPPTPPPPPLPPKHASILSQYPYTNDTNHTSIEQGFYYHPQILPKHLTSTEQHSGDFYDRPYDGYNSSQQILSYAQTNYCNNKNIYYHAESSGSTSPGTSIQSSRDLETSSSISDIVNAYPTHLSPPPYRQVSQMGRQTTNLFSNNSSDQNNVQ